MILFFYRMLALRNRIVCILNHGSHCKRNVDLIIWARLWFEPVIFLGSFHLI